jgi:hypothetical protein
MPTAGLQHLRLRQARVIFALVGGDLFAMGSRKAHRVVQHGGGEIRHAYVAGVAALLGVEE